jgi:hypothetical protein
MVENNPGGVPWLAVYMGALASLFLHALGQLTPYEDAYHEFHDTYINAGHNYAWPAYTAYQLTLGPGLTNFMVVELGAVTVWGLLALASGGAVDVACGLLLMLAAFVAWLLSSALKLHWY